MARRSADGSSSTCSRSARARSAADCPSIRRRARKSFSSCPLPPRASRVRAPMINDEQTYLAFVWTTGGYELREERGELPHVGSTVESDGKRWTVLKVGP